MHYYLLLFYFIFYTRGKDFRKEFCSIGEVRSLIHENVQFMALTATATSSSRAEICSILGMKQPKIVSSSPNRPNIKYSVCNGGEMEDSFSTLIEDIQRNRTSTDKTIIFCRTYESCGMLYMLLKNSLGRNFTEPVGAPDNSRYRLGDMYTACTRKDVKEEILSSFPKKNSKLRIIVATVAFGMGLDCPDVRRIIHWGPPED